MKVRYTEAALGEIESVFSYVAERDSAAAARIVMRVEQLALRLSDFPLLGQPADEAGIRILPLGRYPYLVFYTVMGEEVIVLHVRHAARLRP